LITDHYRQRTWLFSAYSADLHPLSRPPAPDTLRLAEELRARHKAGMKCATVAIGSQDPYADVDFWQQFCKNNGFIWVTGAEEIRGAVRRQKLALLPVITAWQHLDRNGLQLRTLKAMKVQILDLRDTGSDTAGCRVRVKPAADLGMMFLVSQRQAELLPEESRKVIYLDNSSTLVPTLSKAELEKTRYALSQEFSGLAPDSTGMTSRSVFLELKYDQETLRYLSDLEKAGFKAQDIVYMLGENLLEILP